MIKKAAFYIYHEHLKRDRFFEFVDFFNQTQYWSTNKILDYQWERFKELLEYAYHKTPYYKKLLDDNGLNPKDIQSRDELPKIPVLTKDIIKDNFSGLRAEGISRSRIKTNSTSGSTGEKLNFLSDKGTVVRPALQNRCYDWMGIKYLDKKMSIWGAAWDVKKSQQIKSRIKGYIKNWRVLSGYHLSDRDIEAYHQLMLRFKPKLLLSYPSILYDLARTFDENGFGYTPTALQIGGEKLFSFQRSYIEQTFKVPLFDFYGGRDISMIAQDCDKHEGLHIMAESVLLEVLDENGLPVNEGEGDLVLTDLNNKVMPFIRYKIGDRAIVSLKKCSCGRGLPLLKEIIGRSFETIEFPNGNKVGGTFWTLVMRSEHGIKRFQVIQKEKDRILVHYIPDSATTSIPFGKLTERIHEYSGDQLKIAFKEVDAIPPTKAGKFRFVIKDFKN